MAPENIEKSFQNVEYCTSRFSDDSDQLKKIKYLKQFIYKEDFEWLGQNWRKIRIGVRTMINRTKHFNTKRAAFLEMVDENFQFFPSLKQIFDGIHLALIQ